MLLGNPFNSGQHSSIINNAGVTRWITNTILSTAWSTYSQEPLPNLPNTFTAMDVDPLAIPYVSDMIVPATWVPWPFSSPSPSPVKSAPYNRSGDASD